MMDTDSSTRASRKRPCPARTPEESDASPSDCLEPGGPRKNGRFAQLMQIPDVASIILQFAYGPPGTWSHIDFSGTDPRDIPLVVEYVMYNRLPDNRLMRDMKTRMLENLIRTGLTTAARSMIDRPGIVRPANAVGTAISGYHFWTAAMLVKRGLPVPVRAVYTAIRCIDNGHRLADDAIVFFDALSSSKGRFMPCDVPDDVHENLFVVRQLINATRPSYVFFGLIVPCFIYYAHDRREIIDACVRVYTRDCYRDDRARIATHLETIAAFIENEHVAKPGIPLCVWSHIHANPDDVRFIKIFIRLARTSELQDFVSLTLRHEPAAHDSRALSAFDLYSIVMQCVATDPCHLRQMFALEAVKLAAMPEYRHRETVFLDVLRDCMLASHPRDMVIRVAQGCLDRNWMKGFELVMDQGLIGATRASPTVLSTP